jgi:heptaprenyl diphosphate synthase
MIALSMALHVAESLLPWVLPMPGVKLGLANIITVICLYIFSRRAVAAIVLVRLVLVGLIIGSLFTPSFWISCGGAFASFMVMALGRSVPGFSPVGVSLFGATAHNMGQLFVVSQLMNSQAVFYYLPWLLIWAIPMGLLTGFSAKTAIQALRNIGVNDTIR